jgi:hypothetical protein
VDVASSLQPSAIKIIRSRSIRRVNTSRPEKSAQAVCIAGIELPYVHSDALSIAIVNPLGRARRGIARVSAAGLPREFELVDPRTHERVPCERLGGTLEILTPLVPACGYIALEVRPVHRGQTPRCEFDWQEATLSLHRNDYTLQFHEAGGLARWHDRMRSCQWCSDAVESPLGSVLCDFGPAKRRGAGEFIRTGPAAAQISTKFTSLAARVTVEAACPARGGDGAVRYRTEYTLYAGWRELHVRVQLLGDSAAMRAAYAFFPVSGEDPRVFLNRTGESVEVTKPASAGATMPIRALRLQGTHSGMNLYPLQTPLIALGHAGEYGFPAKGCKNSLVYATLLDNAREGDGACPATTRQSWEFVLQPTGSDDADGGLTLGAADLHRPLVGTVLNGRLASSKDSLVEIDGHDVQLVGLRPARNGDAILRLCNPAPQDAAAHLKFPRHKAGRLVVCDLLGRPSEAIIPIRSGKATLPLAANRIATFLLEA